MPSDKREAVRRWLKQHAAAAKMLHLTVKHEQDPQTALACMSGLLSELPGLEVATVEAERESDTAQVLAGVLSALAWCPCLQTLTLYVEGSELMQTSSAHSASLVSAFAKLSSLVKLEWGLPFELSSAVIIVGALSGLIDLTLHGFEEEDPGEPAPNDTVPASLSALKHLQRLSFHSFHGLTLEAGCLNLPRLALLEFSVCIFAHSRVQLPGLDDLSSLSSLELARCDGLCSLSIPGLLRLPRLQHLAFWDRNRGSQCTCARRLWSNLPADMGAASCMLLSLDLSKLNLDAFPLALTGLTGLECLKASGNGFSVLPAPITAMGRLGTLQLGRGLKFAETPSGGLRAMPYELFDASALGRFVPLTSAVLAHLFHF